MQGDVYDSPFYIQIDSAVIYNEMGNTLFGNPQPLRHIQLITTLLDTGMYYYIRNIYLLQQADSTSYHIEIIDDDNNDNNKNGGTTSNNNNNLNNVIDYNDIDTQSSGNNINTTVNSSSISNSSNDDPIIVNNNNNNNNSSNSQQFEDEDEEEDDGDFSDVIDDGNAIPEINATTPLENTMTDEEQDQISDNENSYRILSSNSKRKKSTGRNRQTNLIERGENPVRKRVMFAATQQSQIFEDDDEEDEEENDDDNNENHQVDGNHISNSDKDKNIDNQCNFVFRSQHGPIMPLMLCPILILP